MAISYEQLRKSRVQEVLCETTSMTKRGETRALSHRRVAKWMKEKYMTVEHHVHNNNLSFVTALLASITLFFVSTS